MVMVGRSRSRRLVPVRNLRPQKIAKMARQVSKLNKAIYANRHQMNNSADLNPLTTAGTITYLSTIAIGDDNADRDGAAISPDYLKVWCTNNYFQAAGVGICRYIIFQDKQSYGAAPAVLDVLQTADPNSQFNVPNKLAGRFRILMDWMFTGINGQDKQFHIRKKTMKPGKVNFTGTTAAVASAGMGAIYLLRITSTAAATAPSDIFRWSIGFKP